MHTPAPKEANPAMTSRIAVDFFCLICIAENGESEFS